MLAHLHPPLCAGHRRFGCCELPLRCACLGLPAAYLQHQGKAGKEGASVRVAICVCMCVFMRVHVSNTSQMQEAPAAWVPLCCVQTPRLCHPCLCYERQPRKVPML